MRIRLQQRRSAVVLFVFVAYSGFSGQGDIYRQQREAMVRDQLIRRGISDPRVLAAMRTVPRHLFVPEAYRDLAYADSPLPIGSQQTISQPYIVALMTQSLELKKGEKVLEIGTGSGYQAAVLALLTDQVYSLEIIPELAERAAGVLFRLGYSQVQVKCEDGHEGWSGEAPFDAVIITCASSTVPPLLFNQLKEGGRMILPLGDPRTYQVLTRVFKRNGKAVHEKILDVRFVPMTKKKKQGE